MGSGPLLPKSGVVGWSLMKLTCFYAGIDRSGLDQHAAYSKVTDFQVQRLREGLERELGGAVRCFERRGKSAADTRHIHDDAGTSLSPRGQDRLDDAQRAERVYLEHLSDTIEWIGFHRPSAKDGCVVDDCTERTNVFKTPRHRVIAGDIEHMCLDAFHSTGRGYVGGDD